MSEMRLDHVQLAMPRTGEAVCREFYVGVLGWREVEKPAALRSRAGLWFDIGDGSVHLGIDDDFHAARQAHPAFVVPKLDELAGRLRAAQVEVRFDDAMPGVRRFYAFDPVGNRLEFMEDVTRRRVPDPVP